MTLPRIKQRINFHAEENGLKVTKRWKKQNRQGSTKMLGYWSENLKKGGGQYEENNPKKAPKVGLGKRR